MKQPNIFSELDYRSYLRKVVNFLKHSNISVRAFLRTCGITNPSYLNLVVSGKRNLTQKTAAKIANGLKLKSEEKNYLLDLVKINSFTDEEKNALLLKVKTKSFAKTGQTSSDQSLHSHWSYGVIYELAGIKGLDMSVENIKNIIRQNLSPDEIKKALHFLTLKGWIIPESTAGSYRQNEIDFLPKEDVRQLDVRLEHSHFLDQAKLRLNDDVTEREIRGLTFAAPQNKLPEIKDRLRKLTRELNQEMMISENKDCIFRLQVALFKLTKT